MEKNQEAVWLRVYLVRQVLEGARERVSDESPVARMHVVWSLDHAVELLVGTLSAKLGASAREPSLKEMLRTLLEAHPSLHSFRHPIERLRELRNLVQHRGVIPSSEEVRLACPEAETFIRNAVREVLSRELEEVTLVAQVEDRRRRDDLESAEKALAAGDYRAAIRHSGAAFNAWRTVSNADISSFSPLAFPLEETANAAKWALECTQRSDDLPDSARPALAVLAKFVDYFAVSLRGSFVEAGFMDSLAPYELLAYGVDPARSLRFQKLAGHTHTLRTPEVSEGRLVIRETVVVDPDWNPTRNDAAFAIDYVCDALLRLQAWGKRFPKPPDPTVQRVIEKLERIATQRNRDADATSGAADSTDPG